MPAPLPPPYLEYLPLYHTSTFFFKFADFPPFEGGKLNLMSKTQHFFALALLFKDD